LARLVQLKRSAELLIGWARPERRSQSPAADLTIPNGA
jgi:hypothetical protein